MKFIQSLFTALISTALMTSPAYAQSASGSAHTSTSVNTGGLLGTATGTAGNAVGAVGATATGITDTAGRAVIGASKQSLEVGASADAHGKVDWDTENAYWREQYPNQNYYSAGRDYTVYEPAYRYGVDLYAGSNGRNYNELSEEELRKGWERARAHSPLSWSEARLATRDSYMRAYNHANMNAGTSAPTAER